MANNVNAIKLYEIKYINPETFFISEKSQYESL